MNKPEVSRKLKSFRLDESLLLKLENQAKKEGRSLSNMVEKALWGYTNEAQL